MTLRVRIPPGPNSRRVYRIPPHTGLCGRAPPSARTSVRGRTCRTSSRGWSRECLAPLCIRVGSSSGTVYRAIPVGPLVPVDLHGHESLVDELRDFRILIGLLVDDVAPVAPHGPDVEEDWLVLLRLRECFLPPRGTSPRAGGPRFAGTPTAPWRDDSPPPSNPSLCRTRRAAKVFSRPAGSRS